MAKRSGGKPIDINKVHTMWGFYLEGQTLKHVVSRCAQAGIQVHKNTIYRYIHKGAPGKGIQSFKERYATLQMSTSQIVDLRTLEVAVAQLDAWRQRVDSGLDVVDLLLERARELLKKREDDDGNPLLMDSKTLAGAAQAVKVAFDAMKRAAETHEILKIIGGTDEDGRDTWIQEHFKGWTAEEHDEFRRFGTWPESQGDPPEFMMLPGGQQDSAPEGEVVETSAETSS